jgi:hypothetical protein
MGSGFPREICPNVHDWGQVCRLEAQKWSNLQGIYQWDKRSAWQVESGFCYVAGLAQ